MKKLFFLILFILICTFSVASAYTSDDILADLTILRDKGVISGLPTDHSSNSAWSAIISAQNSYMNISNGFLGYFIGVTTSDSQVWSDRIIVGYIYQERGSVIPLVVKSANVASNNSSYYDWNVFNGNTRTFAITGSIFNLNGSNSSTGNFAYDKMSWKYFYTTIDINSRSWQQEAGSEYGGSYLLSSFEFTPTDTSGYINITANGVTESFIRRPFSYSVNNTRLGYISNPNDFYAIEGYLSYFIDISGDSNVLETIAGFTKNQNGTYNNNLFITSQGEVTVKTNKLLNMQGVALYFRYKEDANSSYEYSDEYYYYTYFYGSNPVSGDLISPDLNSTADVGLVNALSDFFNTDSGESNVPYLIGSLSTSGDISFSGDFFTSGDIFGFTYVNYDDWGFGDFVVWTINKIIDSFSSYEDVTVSAGFLGSISTADFVIPNSTFKAFIGTISSGLLVVLVLFWYWRLIVSIGTLDLKSLSSYDLDNNFGLF